MHKNSILSWAHLFISLNVTFLVTAKLWHWWLVWSKYQLSLHLRKTLHVTINNSISHFVSLDHCHVLFILMRKLKTLLVLFVIFFNNLFQLIRLTRMLLGISDFSHLSSNYWFKINMSKGKVSHHTQIKKDSGTLPNSHATKLLSNLVSPHKLFKSLHFWKKCKKVKFK